MRSSGAAWAVVALCVMNAAMVRASAKSSTRATQWQPEEWACSPPSVKNKYCPLYLQGDSKCTEEFCPAMAGCAAEDCHAFQGNIRADKLIALDAYAVKGEKCIRQSFSLGECCALCKATKSCNAWSFCNEPEGCGNTCESAKHAFSWYSLPQPWNDVDPEEHPFRLNPSHTCTASGGFPYGTCSLKGLEPEKLAQPTVQQGNQTGWISGVVSPGSVHAIDPLAFVLETDGSSSKGQDVSSSGSLGGLMEEDERKAGAAAAPPEGIEVPVNQPAKTKNAAVGVGSSSSWLLAASSCLVAVVLAAWNPAA